MVAEDAIRHVFSRKARVTAKEEIKMFVSDLERGVGATSVLDLTEIIGQNENAWLFYDNGRVNKTTGVFEEMPIIWQGDTGWMHITHVSADYKPPESPDACRKMDEFLSSLADGDETKIHNLWYILGKVHTKHRDDHAYYLVGAPGTGKSVLVQIAKSITPGKSVPEGLRYVGSVKGLKAYSEAALILFDDLSGHPAEFTRAKGFLQTLITNGDLSCETNYVDGRQAFQFEGTVLFAANAKGFTGDENDGMTRRVRYLETTTKTRPASSNKVGYADELVQSCYGYICQKGLEAVNIGWKE